VQRVSEFEGIKISNIPLGNLREQFYNHYHLVKSKEFESAVTNWGPGTSIDTQYLSWHYWPDQFFTYLTQTSILGVEAYVVGATYFALGNLGKLKENIEYLRDPFSIPGGGGTALKYYKALPGLVTDEIALPNVNSILWENVRRFYREIRNPLFHGNQLDTNNPADLTKIFELLADIYGWIDTWHDPNNIIEGSGWYTKLRRT
jgi:hypothetical protein